MYESFVVLRNRMRQVVADLRAIDANLLKERIETIEWAIAQKPVTATERKAIILLLSETIATCRLLDNFLLREPLRVATSAIVQYNSWHEATSDVRG
jgi:hypothetical protein